MIYIARHQKGSSFSNCLSTVGTNACKRLSRVCKYMRHLKIYTFSPTMEGKHVRVVQTASLIGTHLTTPIRIIDDTLLDCPKHSNDNDALIVAHHTQIPEILSKYHVNDFTWPSTNYDGCILVSQHEWKYDGTYFSQTPRSWWSKMYRLLLVRLGFCA